MSTIEEMLSRYRELGQTASDRTNDPTTRKRAVDERLNLHLVILKEQQKAQNMEHALAEAAARDPQQQFAKQDARTAISNEIDKRVEKIRARMDEASNSLKDIDSNDVAGRQAISDRLLGLHLELQKAMTFAESVQ